MDELSVTRPAPPSTGALVAGNHLCDQVANLLLIDPGVCRRCFLGEPVKVVLAMTEWSISHEDEPDFEVQTVLQSWAKKRGRGVWRTEGKRIEDCRQCHGSGSVPGPFKNIEQWSEEREGVTCPQCRGSRISLKPLELSSNGKGAL